MIEKIILQEVKDAFINEPYIGDDDIVYNNSKNHIECSELKKQFIGIEWYNVSEKLIFENKDVLPFFSAKGFKYYLPSFMTFIISDFYNADTLVDNVIDLLTLPKVEDSIDMAQNIKTYKLDEKIDFDFEGFLYEQVENIDERTRDFFEKVNLFNENQKMVIYKFLKYLDIKYGDEFIYNPIKPIIAIQRFWYKFEL